MGAEGDKERKTKESVEAWLREGDPDAEETALFQTMAKLTGPVGDGKALTGMLRILQHKTNNRIRLLHRCTKSGEVYANMYIFEPGQRGGARFIFRGRNFPKASSDAQARAQMSEGVEGEWIFQCVTEGVAVELEKRWAEAVKTNRQLRGK